METTPPSSPRSCLLMKYRRSNLTIINCTSVERTRSRAIVRPPDALDLIRLRVVRGKSVLSRKIRRKIANVGLKSAGFFSFLPFFLFHKCIYTSHLSLVVGNLISNRSVREAARLKSEFKVVAHSQSINHLSTLSHHRCRPNVPITPRNYGLIWIGRAEGSFVLP